MERTLARKCADNIREMREEIDINQKDFAPLIGIIDQARYSRLENYGMGMNMLIYNKCLQEFGLWKHKGIKELQAEIARIRDLDYKVTDNK